MTTYYLASCWERKDEMRQCRDTLETRIPSAKVNSRWIDLPHEFSFPSELLNADPEGCWLLALNDLEDVASADAVVSFTGEGGRGGRHAEFGFAVATNRRLVIVGPREHVFHTHPKAAVYPTFEAFLADELRRQTAEALLDS